MPVALFTDGIEPEDQNLPIWRFLEFWKFQDLMNGHIYFHRADLFDGETEGLRYLGGDETAKMWHTYAKGNGVAVSSTYAKLKSVLEPLPAEDKAHLGLVRYGNKHLVAGRRNLMINISSKPQYRCTEPDYGGYRFAVRWTEHTCEC
jgi:hypothetical protein